MVRGVAQRISRDDVGKHFHLLAGRQPHGLDQVLFALHVGLAVELIAEHPVVGRAYAELTRRARIALQQHSAHQGRILRRRYLRSRHAREQQQDPDRPHPDQPLI